MAHFNFVISQNAKWGHAGFYIDHRHRMTSSKYAYRKVLFYKKALSRGNCLRFEPRGDFRTLWGDISWIATALPRHS